MTIVKKIQLGLVLAAAFLTVNAFAAKQMDPKKCDQWRTSLQGQIQTLEKQRDSVDRHNKKAVDAHNAMVASLRQDVGKYNQQCISSQKS